MTFAFLRLHSYDSYRGTAVHRGQKKIVARDRLLRIFGDGLMMKLDRHPL